MYEVYTHGCWPYSELVDKETDNIMHMVGLFIVTSVCSRQFKFTFDCPSVHPSFCPLSENVQMCSPLSVMTANTTHVISILFKSAL